MDIEAYARKVSDHDWRSYYGPEYYDAEKVAPALIALATAEKKDLSRQIMPNPPNINLNGPITSNLMFAVGNDHCGSYYPAAFGALDFILEVALNGNTVVARNCALNALIDLYFFEYDAGKPLDEVQRKDKRLQMKTAIAAHNAQLLKLAETDDECNRTMILDFLDSQNE